MVVQVSTSSTNPTTSNSDGSKDTIVSRDGTFWGVSYDKVDTHVTAEGFNDVTSYYKNGALVVQQINHPAGGFTLTTYDASGAWSLAFNQNADGSYDGKHNTAGDFWGVSYASYDRAVNAAGKVVSDTYYDACGDVLVKKTYTNVGSTVEMFDASGQRTLIYNQNADGSHSEQHFLPGSFWGIGYASVTWKDSASDFNYENDYFDASGHEVAQQIYKTCGGFVVTTYDASGSAAIIFNQNADGSYDGKHFVAGTHNGLDYAAYDRAFDKTGAHVADTYFGANNNILVKETFSVTGATTSVDTYAADGSHDVWSAASGTFWGLSYTSRESLYDAQGFNYDIKLLDASRHVIAEKSNYCDGGWSVQLYANGGSIPTSTIYQNAWVGAGYEAVKPIANSAIADQQAYFYDGSGAMQTLVSTEKGVGVRVDNYSGGVQVSSQRFSSDSSAPLGASNQIDFFALDASKTTLAFHEDASNAFATLTLTQGHETLSFALLGQYSAGQFGLTADGHGGSLLTFNQTPALTLAA